MLKQLAVAFLIGTLVLQIVTNKGNDSYKTGAEQIQSLYEEDDMDIKVLSANEEDQEYKIYLEKKKASKEKKDSSEDQIEKRIKKLEECNETLTWPEGVVVECWLQSKTIEGSKVYSVKTDEEYSRIILYLHGGAYVSNLSKKHILWAEELIAETNAKVVMPMYKLAPQGSYEEAYQMLSALYQELLKEDKEITIMGDSAGGGLALGFVEDLNKNHVAVPEKMVLISPWTDITLSNPAIEDYKDCDLKLNIEWIQKCGELWTHGLDPKDYRVSPLYGNMENLPKTLMTLGTEEILVPDDMLLYEKIKEGGNYVRLLLGEGMYHNYPLRDSENGSFSRKIIEAFIRM